MTAGRDGQEPLCETVLDESWQTPGEVRRAQRRNPTAVWSQASRDAALEWSGANVVSYAELPIRCHNSLVD